MRHPGRAERDPGSECRTPCQIQWTRAFAKMTAIEDSHLQLRQDADMRRDASAQRGQGIATFEAGYDPALRMARRDFNQAFCHPGVIGFPQLQVRQWILSMRIKTGRYEQDLGAMRFERRQPLFRGRGTEFFTAASR